MFWFRIRSTEFAGVERPRSWLRKGAAPMAALAVAATLLIAGCGGADPGATTSPLGVIDRAHRTVQLNLIITGADFNGYSRGQMTVRVPLGWKVDVFCSNQTSTPQSCAVVRGSGSSTPAFPGAACPGARAGVPPGRFVDFSFTVTRNGSYRVTSLVSPHDLGHSAGHGGMWDGFDVVAAGIPSVST
jgi:Sulfocyanin (SoxE) domain